MFHVASTVVAVNLFVVNAVHTVLKSLAAALDAMDPKSTAWAMPSIKALAAASESAERTWGAKVAAAEGDIASAGDTDADAVAPRTGKSVTGAGDPSATAKRGNKDEAAVDEATEPVAEQ